MYLNLVQLIKTTFNINCIFYEGKELLLFLPLNKSILNLKIK